MWKAISQVLADSIGSYYNIKSKRLVENDSLNEAWLISDGNIPVFVKVNSRSLRSMFRAEADQLQLLAKTQTVNVPHVYGIGVSSRHSFILLEALPLSHFSTCCDITDFGKQMAKLHRWSSSKCYGLEYDTWLGEVYQPNQWQQNWSTFFSQQRIGWQLQLCAEKGIYFGELNEIIQFVANALAKYQPRPALLHGNFYLDNCGVAEHQTITFDPACWWGDRECDIAFSELFRHLPTSFYQAYQAEFPLDAHYEHRKPLYQLYYLLSYSQRFGEPYISQTKQLLSHLLSK